MTALKIVSQNKCFEGTQSIFSHESSLTNCAMRFGVYEPPQAKTQRLPTLYWLSGLTCTEENFIIKANAQRVAAELGIIIVTPDTSPRGLNLLDEKAIFSLGVGAGYYMDATVAPWSKGYRMYSYVTKELPNLLHTNFAIDENRVGIMGHSMGGYGALMIALKNQSYYKSVSAFSPICSLLQSPWGLTALESYLGPNQPNWLDYDVIALVKERKWQGPTILVDQGTQDQFLKTQLKPELFVAACKEANVPLELRMQAGYDHSYFFIMSFIEDHLRFHYQNLS